jgi:hypothetical protein
MYLSKYIVCRSFLGAMKSRGYVLLFPTLKVAQFLGLLPCHQLRNNRLLHSKVLSTVFNFLFIFVFAPVGYYFLIKSASRPASQNPVGSSVLLVCVTFSHIVGITFLVAYCWHFISNSCAVLSKAMSVFVFVEKKTGARQQNFRLLILTYQCVGLFASFSLCLNFVIRFSMGTNWQIQTVINFTRMQIYTVEQCVNVLNFIFANHFRQVSNSLKCQSNQMLKMKV